MSFLKRVETFATNAHVGQFRKNKARDPYITHPIEVMQLLVDCGVSDESILAAALLHDVVEDTPVTLDDIREEFGDDVAELVAEVTDNKKLPKKERKIAQLERIAKASVGAQMIKMADKYSNCKDLITDPPIGWGKDNIMGYAVWSFVLCNNVKNDVNEKLKSTVNQMFKSLFNLYPESIDIGDLLNAYYDKL